MEQVKKTKLKRYGTLNFTTPESIQRTLATKLKKYGYYNKPNQNTYSRVKRGWLKIGNKKIFYRSQWERNYACYLEWLKQKGEIKNWKHESKTFWFKTIKRGVRSYLPDFEIKNNDNTIEYHEVKGWMDKKSQTKLSRMAKYYPDIKLILIDEEQYKALKKWAKLIPQWED